MAVVLKVFRTLVAHRSGDMIMSRSVLVVFFFFQAEDGIRDHCVTGVQTCALPISVWPWSPERAVVRFADLTLANLTTARSGDQGQTVTCQNNGVPDTLVDRQWYADRKSGV